MNRIRELREAMRLTQEELGILTGLSPSHISRLENDTTALDADKIERLSRVFKVPAWQLFLPPDAVKKEVG